MNGKWGFPDGSDGKESTHNAEDPGSTPGLERSPGEGNGYPLQYSCLENPRDRGVSWAADYGTAESDTTEQLTRPQTQMGSASKSPGSWQRL